MSTSNRLRPEVMPPDPDFFIPFLRESYGPNYAGDASIRSNFDRVSKVVTLTDGIGGIAAASSIEEVSFNRMITVATSPDVQRFGKRSSLMTQLLEECREGGHALWITIGHQYDRMIAAAEKAGMNRVSEKATVEEILAKAGLEGFYTVSSDYTESAQVVRSGGPKQGSTQQVWAWDF